MRDYLDIHLADQSIERSTLEVIDYGAGKPAIQPIGRRRLFSRKPASRS